MTQISIGTPVDPPYEDDFEASAPRSPLAGLRKKIEDRIIEPLILVHPTLNGEDGTDRWEMVFPREIPDLVDRMKRWRRVTSKIKDLADQNAKYTALVVADCCTAMRCNGTPVLDSEGDQVNFQNREFQAEMEVHTAADAAKVFIDAARLSALSNQVLRALGVGVELEEGAEDADPTSGG